MSSPCTIGTAPYSIQYVYIVTLSETLIFHVSFQWICGLPCQIITSSCLLAAHAPYYSEILIGVKLIKHYLPLQRVIKRSHHVNSIGAMPFPCPLSFHLPNPHTCPSSLHPHHHRAHSHTHTLIFFFSFLINHLFCAWESRGDLRCYSWLRPGSHISKRERWSACCLVPAHTHLLKGQKQLTPHFPHWQTTRRRGLLRTPRYRDGNQPHSAQVMHGR